MTLRNNSNSNNSVLSPLLGLLLVVGLFVAVYYIFRSIYSILLFLSPILLIITLILDYKIVINFLKQLYSLFERNWAMGLVAILLTAVFYPFVIGFLLFQAIMGNSMKRRAKEAQEKYIGEYVDFEDVSEQPEKNPIKPEIEESPNSDSDQIRP